MSTRIKSGKHKFLNKPCKRCEKIFQPESKYNNICSECIRKSGRRREKR